VSSTRFKHPCVHPQEDMYMQSCHWPDCLYRRTKEIP